MFKAKCSAEMVDGRGWVLTFKEVAPDDLQLLGHTLIGEFGVLALPEPHEKPSRRRPVEARAVNSVG
ncbi:MAG: hypothetical protein GQE15_25540 [Archangiaceae bacterium]|nr:hypothetical protein [Archangiaceae bacterium]